MYLNFQIAIIEGDNIIHKEGDLRSIPVKEIETNDALPENILSVNAYLGAPSIKKALELGADIIMYRELSLNESLPPPDSDGP